MDALYTFISKFYLIIEDPNIGEGRANLIVWSATIIVATVAFYFRGLRENRNFRNSKSAEFFLTENENLDEAINSISHLAYDQTNCCKRFEGEEGKKLNKQFETIIKHFEIVSIGISAGYLSENYIVNAERFRLTRCFMCLSPKIQDARDVHKHTTSSENFEKLFLRTYFPLYKLISYPIEFFLPWPLFTISRLRTY